MSKSYNYLKKSLLLSAFFLSNTFASTVFTPESNDLLLAPKCFMENNSFEHNVLVSGKADDMVLFSVNKEYWWKQLESINHQANCGKFVSVYNEWQEYLNTKKLNPTRISESDFEYFLNDYLTSFNKIAPSTFNHANTGKADSKAELLETLYAGIDQDRVWSSLDEFTAFYNRAAYSDTGFQAAGHVKTWMELLAVKNDLADDNFSVSYVTTNSFYRQPSVVAVLGKNLPGDALVISAHMDTNGGGRRPGADDDGSGSMVVLEAARLLATSGHKFDRPIYFVWYAAEEVGLVGSKRVVRDFRSKNVKVDSILHFDTVGRRAKADDPTLWLLKDHVNLDFTNYVAGLIENQVKVPVNYTTCGYACSDHASWDDAGFVATAAFESAFDDMNPYLHTSNDVKDHVSLENLVNYTKLALAYAVDKAA